MHKLAMSIIGVILLATMAAGSGATGPAAVRTLDGSGNNPATPTGARPARSTCGSPRRTTPTAIGSQCAGPPPRYVSNRIFNDVGQNMFSENDISQWGWAWGQFIDHDIGLRDETPAERAPIAVRRDATRSRRSPTTSARSSSRARRPRRARA